MVHHPELCSHDVASTVKSCDGAELRKDFFWSAFLARLVTAIVCGMVRGLDVERVATQGFRILGS